MKLQDAYAAETGAAGSWKVIGYIGPGEKASNNKSSGTTVFAYADDFSPSDETKETTLVGELSSDDEGEVAWSASAKTALNDCAINSKWTINIAKGDASGSCSTIKYIAKVPQGGQGGSDANCLSLTANFENIGK